MSERIGIVTGGGDCPGLNAVIRAVAKAAAKRGWEPIGFLGGCPANWCMVSSRVCRS
jgi:6-phosphofructokinase 1